MKYHFLLLGLLILPDTDLISGPREDLTFNRKLRADAIHLFRQGNASQGVARLRSKVKAEFRGGDPSIEVAQQLIDMAFYFFARRETTLARRAVNESIGEVRKLRPTSRNAVHVASLYCNLGRACDRILHDVKASNQYYAAAAAIDPANAQARERSQSAGEKLRRRKSLPAR